MNLANGVIGLDGASTMVRNCYPLFAADRIQHDIFLFARGFILDLELAFDAVDQIKNNIAAL